MIYGLRILRSYVELVSTIHAVFAYAPFVIVPDSFSLPIMAEWLFRGCGSNFSTSRAPFLIYSATNMAIFVLIIIGRFITISLIAMIMICGCSRNSYCSSLHRCSNCQCKRKLAKYTLFHSVSPFIVRCTVFLRSRQYTHSRLSRRLTSMSGHIFMM